MTIDYKDYLSSKENYTLIDIRATETIEKTGSIEGSIKIFKELLEANLSDHLEKEKSYILFCGSGNSAGRISALATEAGYDVTSLTGGFKSYIEETENN